MSPYFSVPCFFQWQMVTHPAGLSSKPSPWHHHFDASTTSQLKRVEKGVCESRVTTGFFLSIHMGGSKNRGTPKSSILIGFSIINHPFWGTPIFGNTHMFPIEYLGAYSSVLLIYQEGCVFGEFFFGFLLFFFLVDFLSKIDDLWSSSSTAWAHLFDGLSFLHCDD